MFRLSALARRSALLLLLTALSLPATANLFEQGSARFSSWLSNNSAPEFLPPEEAFRPQVWLEGRQIRVLWQIEPDYYLYRDRLTLEITNQPGAVVTQMELSPSTTHEDEYFGVSQVYYNQAEMLASINGRMTGDNLTLLLGYQGCASAGLCYPPQRLEVDVSLAGWNPAAELTRLTLQAAPAASDTADESTVVPVTTSGTLAQALQSGQLWLLLGLFFVAGLGLTFTPCVLPMLPIVSAIVIGRGDTQSTSKKRALLLSSAYVLGMALTYLLIGVVIGLFGAGLNLQAALQSPWVLIPFALLFLLLALAMFGVWELRLPAWLDQQLQQLQQPRKGTLLNVLLMGALSTLVVSPCMTAPLAGALAFIAATGNALNGGLALFALGLGMGVPLILTATFGAHWLPRAGAWMNQVKAVFGWLLLLVAAWLIERLLPASLALAMWGVLALGTGVFVGGLNFQAGNHWAKLRLTLGLVLIVYGISLFVGALAGQRDPLQPLAWQPAESRPAAMVSEVPIFNNLDDLNQLLQHSSRPVLVDLYADWCISCKIMENRVFPQPEIQQELTRIQRVKLDLTRIDAPLRQWMQEKQLFGPPTFLFYQQGQELTQWRVQGEMNTRQLLQHLRAFNRQQPG